MLSTGPLPERVASYHTAKLLSALKWIHESGIFYVDVKVDSLMLTYDGQIKITNILRSSIVGTDAYLLEKSPSCYKDYEWQDELFYMSPEVINTGEATSTSDYWAAGVFLFFLLSKTCPFSQDSEDSLRNDIINGSIHWESLPAVDDATVSFISNILKVNPSSRLGFCDTTEILNSEFVSSSLSSLVERTIVQPSSTVITSENDLGDWIDVCNDTKEYATDIKHRESLVLFPG